MRWILPLIILVGSAAGCGDRADPTDAPLPDPELAAVAFLKDHVFADVDALRPRFARAVDPADFPLRLLLPDPSQYRFVDLYRARSVDGRAVVSALIEIEGQPNAFEMWLELQEGRWRIAGWANAPVVVDPSRPAPEGGVQVPPDLSPATFRGAPKVIEVPIASEISLADIEEMAVVDARVKVNIKPLTFDGACPKRALKRAIKKLSRSFSRCYVDATDGKRRGRLTLQITFDRGQRPAAYLSETTLLNNDLSECLLRLAAALPPSVGADESCDLTVPIVFRPR